MPDEEFDVLSLKDLVLLSKQFERLYTNKKNAKRSSSMCYRCGKHEHFITECPEAMEVKPKHKHRPRTDTRSARGTTTRARTSLSKGQGGVVVTRRRMGRWWLVRTTST
jgi:hypothetical protein